MPYEGEVVRARLVEGRPRLYKGGDQYVDLPDVPYTREQISPTRDTRLRWMQSVIRCTHYVAGPANRITFEKKTSPRSPTSSATPSSGRMKPMSNPDLSMPPSWPSAAIPTTSNSAAAASSSLRSAPDVRAAWSFARAASRPATARRKNDSKSVGPARALGASLELIELDGDARLEEKAAHAIRLAGVIRRLRPATVLAPTPVENQHPDHYRLGRLVRDATRIARYGGVADLRGLAPHAIDQLFFYAMSPGAEPRDLSPILVDVSAPETLAAWTAAMESHATQVKARAYVEMQLTRARVNGLRAGVGHAIALYPNDPPLVDSLRGWAAVRADSDMSCDHPLRIGITCYPSVGGSGILASSLGVDLARRGHDVHFISYERPSGSRRTCPVCTTTR